MALDDKVWAAQTVSSNRTVYLDDNIQLTGTVTVSGCTLTIINEKSSNYTIKCTKANISMFVVKSNAKLIIKGNANGRIIIDGGADFTWTNNHTELPVMRLTPSADGIKTANGINNSGELSFEYVTIQDINGSDDNGGAFLIHSSKETILDNCIIQNCYSRLGSAIMISSGAGAVRLSNSTVTRCITGGDSNDSADNTGGAIRTYGSVASSLYLTNCTLSYNYAMREYNEYNNTLRHDANGGAIFWNARGTDDTKCVINGCIFEYNLSDDNGGAIKSQGTLVFEGNTTTIKNNYAPNGAGIYIEGYTGGSGVSGVRTIRYILNDRLNIQENISPSYNYNGNEFSGKGAGIHFYFGSEMTLEAGSAIEVDMCGAILEDNKADGANGLGGGIYFENTSLASKNYKFAISLNHGKIKNNVSTGDGGGVYIYDGNVTSSSSGDSKLEILSNKAASSGGGVYITGGGNFSLTGGTITENTSEGNGGGAYIAGGNLSVTNGEISKNSAVMSGGGIAIVDGKVEMEKGSILNNKSQNYGGGVYVSNTSTTQQSVILTGGSLVGNNARYGGGLCVDGNIKLTVGDIEIDGNEAVNGGGI